MQYEWSLRGPNAYGFLTLQTGWIHLAKVARLRLAYTNCMIIHAANAPPAKANNSAVRENTPRVSVPRVEEPVT